MKHLYTHGAKRGMLRKFENRYGVNKGKRVYGAVVGKVKRERMAKKSCLVHGMHCHIKRSIAGT